MLLCTFLCVFLLCSCESNLSIEEQAWNEAVTYITWYADKYNADVKPGVYSNDRVIKNYDLKVAVTNSEGAYAQW